jgi:hypothetical protein
MLTFRMIKLLHLVFVSSLGLTAFWLFCKGLLSEKAVTPSPTKRKRVVRVKRDRKEKIL